MSIYLLILILNHQYSSITPTRFVTNPSLIQNLYYDFKFSSANSKTQSIIVEGVGGVSQCSLLCLLNSDFRCDAFLHFNKNQSCFLSSVISTRNITIYNLFRRIPDCPDNFAYIRYYNKCYSWKLDSWNWSEANAGCNMIDSHPLVIDDALEIQALKTFMEQSRTNYSKCQNRYKFTWTAGIMADSNRDQFLWKPYNLQNGIDPYIPITYYKWAKNQPDNYMGVENCLHLRLKMEYNDDQCNSTMCPVCEIDV